MKGKSLIRRIKQNRVSTSLANIKQGMPDVHNLPRDVMLSQFANKIKLRQIECINAGSPITAEELEQGLRKDWNKIHIRTSYLGAGINFNDLVEAGRDAIENYEDAAPLPKVVQWLTAKVERNVKCPCGSGKKYKKCCGKGA